MPDFEPFEELFDPDEQRHIARKLEVCFPYLDTAEVMRTRCRDFSGMKFTGEEHEKCHKYTEMLKNLSDIAHGHGLLAWEELLPDIENPFLKGAMTLAVDGVDPEITEYILKSVISIETPEGAELLSRLMIMQGIIRIQNGKQL